MGTRDASARATTVEEQQTVYTDCGARTNFAPPPASMERLKVRDVDGRTMFDVYEPRYHAEPEPKKKRKRSEASPAPQGLIDILEQKPAIVLAVLFTVVLLTSATVTALLHR